MNTQALPTSSIHYTSIVFSAYHNQFFAEDQCLLCDTDQDYYLADDFNDIIVLDYKNRIILRDNAEFCPNCGQGIWASEDEVVYVNAEETFYLLENTVEADGDHYPKSYIDNQIVLCESDNEYHLSEYCTYSEYHDHWIAENDLDYYVFIASMDSYVCQEETSICYACNESILSDDSINCSECGDTFCDSCCCDCSSDDNVDVEHYSGTLLDYHTKPVWPFFKKNYEREFNPIFLGVELEVEFPDSKNEDDLAEICQKYLRGRYILKKDSSLNNGAEIVFAPHTLNSFKDINLKNFLDELKDNDFLSYTGGTCGLHVHVSRSALKISQSLKNQRVKKTECAEYMAKFYAEKYYLINLSKFFYENKAKLRKFSQRSRESLDQWAKIPDNLDSLDDVFHRRNSAINCTAGETIEFRLFRGTLDYSRFKSTLQFTDAIINFHNLGTIPKSWTNFRKFVEATPRYTILKNYMIKRNLFISDQ